MRGLCRLLITRGPPSIIWLLSPFLFCQSLLYINVSCLLFIFVRFFPRLFVDWWVGGWVGGWVCFFLAIALGLSFFHLATISAETSRIFFSYIPSTSAIDSFRKKFYLISLVRVCWSRFARISCVDARAALPEFASPR
jgi:hypothetical protein